jgi:hypothetical protein
MIWQTSVCFLYSQFSQPASISVLYSDLALPLTLAHWAERKWLEINVSPRVDLSIKDCASSTHCLHFWLRPKCKSEHLTQGLGSRFKNDAAHLAEHFLLQNTLPLLEYLRALGALVVGSPHIPHSAVCFSRGLKRLLCMAAQRREQNRLLHFWTSLELLVVACPQFAQFTLCVAPPKACCCDFAEQLRVQKVFRECFILVNTLFLLFMIALSHPAHESGNKSLLLNLLRKSSVRCWY